MYRFVFFGIILAGLLAGPSIVAAQGELGPDHYPSLGFTVLDPPERQTFLALAEGELCPCPGTPRSLSECLMDASDRCPLAVEVASIMMRHIKEDLDDDDIRDTIVRHITEATTPREFDLSDAFVIGAVDAPVQIVVFSDFECPFCRAFSSTIEMLSEHYGDQVAIYFKHFPLPQHANATPAARAAIAAGQQGKFWEMHNLLFENQSELRDASEPIELFVRLATELGLDPEQFATDYQSDDIAAVPANDREEGRAAGVNSTPTCFINGIRFRDQETFAAIQTQINALLAAE